MTIPEVRHCLHVLADLEVAGGGGGGRSYTDYAGRDYAESGHDHHARA
jgi:hypothetical protein